MSKNNNLDDFGLLKNNTTNPEINTSWEMPTYFMNIVIFLSVSLYVISLYYSAGSHAESTSYSMYFLTIIGVYSIYKFIKTSFSKDKVLFSPAGIIGYTFINIFILCAFFFNLSSGQNGTLVLFFKIIGFLILPFSIGLINYSFAKKILSYIPSYKNEEIPFKFILALGLGFVIFFTLITISATLGQYNLTSVFAILLILAGISFKELYQSIISLATYKIEFDNHKTNSTTGDLVNLNLLSAEWSFIILSFLVGINFINIVRPMPIGWDDLGVYMNFPQIMANSGTILKGAGLVAWQLLTGIGFMFHSAPQAFFMNQIGGILSIIVLTVVFSDLLKGSSKKHLSVPIILATMFYAMPMVIFEQAKDMKVDPGLFFVSVIGIYLIYKLFLRYLGYEETKIISNTDSIVSQSKDNITLFFSKISSVFKSNTGESGLFDNKDYLIYIAIVGAIVGLAFAIKVSSVMLILGIIGVIFYSKLGFSGFLGYFALFIGVFTKLKLWDMMNVNYPKDNLSWINTVSMVFIVISLILFSYSFIKYKKESFIKATIITLVFVFGVIASLSPWLIKNISELKTQKISIGTMLGGEGSNFVADYSKIYSKDELAKIEEKFKVEATSASGKTQNEDLGRYFGYEDGVNNYLKLPWNLTLQKNQAGEYTDITFFFLALIPLIFVFLQYKNYVFSFGVLIAFAGGILYFNDGTISKELTSFFSKQLLPDGYSYILAIFLGSLAYFLYTLKNDKISQVFKLNLVFFTMYAFLFVIAAYGIVWYGIAMYFALLLMIGAGLANISESKNDETYDLLRIFGSFLTLIVISVYFFNSTLPHGISNLTQAGFTEFKAGLINQEEAIFASHPDYFTILSYLNITDQAKLAQEEISGISNDNLKNVITQNLGAIPNITKLDGILKEIKTTDLSKLITDPLEQQNIKLAASEVQNKIYKEVLYPSKEYQNEGKIYRIGTFLTYFIYNNRDRYYDDSLVQSFQKYFYNSNPDITVERMKKLGIKYFLTDLNAATIDKDPRHDLTMRFENLLKTFKSDKLELIQTDSICLQIALEEKAPNYMSIAGVNYESYGTGGVTIPRGQKQLECYNHILDLMKQNKITDTVYPYLKPLANYLTTNKVTDQNEVLKVFQQYVGHGWLALFRIK